MSANSPPDSEKLQAMPARVGDVLNGRYRLTRLIGKGGMGVVYEGMHLTLERKVAVKLMSSQLASRSDYRRRFDREVLITKELNHPNLVRIYDFGTDESGTMFLVMEYLEGHELTEEIDAGPMPLDRLGMLGRQMLDGLAEAQAMDVIHRDLKPGNIFLVENHRGEEVLKILDFGVAKSLDDKLPEITRTGEIVGTVRYMPPEALTGDSQGKTTDVYACGLLFWEMLCGRPIISAPSIREMMEFHHKMPIVFPESVAEHPLAQLILRATEKDTRRRYADAEMMYEALMELAPQHWPSTTVPKDEVDRIQAQIYNRLDIPLSRLPTQSPPKPDIPIPTSNDDDATTVVLDESDRSRASDSTISVSESIVEMEADLATFDEPTAMIDLDAASGDTDRRNTNRYSEDARSARDSRGRVDVANSAVIFSDTFVRDAAEVALSDTFLGTLYDSDDAQDRDSSSEVVPPPLRTREKTPKVPTETDSKPSPLLGSRRIQLSALSVVAVAVVGFAAHAFLQSPPSQADVDKNDAREVAVNNEDVEEETPPDVKEVRPQELDEEEPSDDSSGEDLAPDPIEGEEAEAPSDARQDDDESPEEVQPEPTPPRQRPDPPEPAPEPEPEPAPEPEPEPAPAPAPQPEPEPEPEEATDEDTDDSEAFDNVLDEYL